MARLSATNMANLVDSDSESEDALGGHRTSATTTKKPTSARPAKTGGKASTAPKAPNRVTKPAQKPKAASRTIKGKAAETLQAEVDRQALAMKSDNVPTAQRGRPKKTAIAAGKSMLNTPPESDEAKKPAGRGRPKHKTIPKPSRAKATVPVPVHEIDVTPMEEDDGEEREGSEIVDSIERDDDDVDDAGIDEPDVLDASPVTVTRPAPKSRHPPRVSPTSARKRPAPQPSQSPLKKRGVIGTGASSDEDPSLRRRLGELSKENDALQVKLRDLRNIGVLEAERTFDQFKKRQEDKTQASAQLIASLKSELAAQKALAKEGLKHKQNLASSESRLHTLSTTLTDSQNALDTAKAEIKTLSNKLSATRAADAASGTARGVVPGSAIKKGGVGGGGVGANSTLIRVDAGLQGPQAAKLKEELYGDLTGLIVTGVKRDRSEDVYDCLQTGRNGTLHFKLAIANETSGDDYEKAEFTYIPQLDDDRDGELIDMLPGFLVDDITFPRPHASKFFARVMRALTESQQSAA